MIFATSLLAALAGTALAGKRGLAWPWYNNQGPLNPDTFVDDSGEVVAIYDWETYAPPMSSSSYSYSGLGWIGMQGTKDSSSSPVAELASRAAAAGWATVMSLNEPDLNGIAPDDAAGWYQQYINPLDIKKALPAVTSSTSSGQGLDWLAQFLSACNGGCYWDYVNIHWYGSSFDDFQSYVNSVIAAYPNNQLIISEFALLNGGDQVSFFTSAFEWLDTVDQVDLYFPFVATSPSLLSNPDDGGSAAGYTGTENCLYNDDGTPSSTGQLMYSTSLRKRGEEEEGRRLAAWK